MTAEDETQDEPRALNVSAAIANALVRLYKQQFGRGPTSARAVWSGPDAVTVFLEDTLTPAERTLLSLGEDARLRETRIVAGEDFSPQKARILLMLMLTTTTDIGEIQAAFQRY